ncbi:hypothetical protein NL676_026283 [Syzygium grande]|nr:hypothetical protein NL676_026283 [Syzygium grande]
MVAAEDGPNGVPSMPVPAHRAILALEVQIFVCLDWISKPDRFSILFYRLAGPLYLKHCSRMRWKKAEVGPHVI